MRSWAALQYIPYMGLAALAYFLPSQFRHILLSLSESMIGLIFTFALLLAFGVLNTTLTKKRSDSSIAWAALPWLPTMFLAAALLLSGGSIVAMLIAASAATVLLGIFWMRYTPSRKAIAIAAVVATVAYIAILVTFVMDPIVWPRTLGPLAVLLMGLGFVSVTLGLLFLKPAIGILATLAVTVCMSFTAPNNHNMTAIDKGMDRFDGSFGDVFVNWVKSRKDLQSYKDAKRPYPVILASAEGGGIYAAAHSYAALASFQARCPSFSQHLFATVGVSGGSFGSLLFSLGTKATKNEALKPCVADTPAPDLSVLKDDHLSPVLARMLFPEFLDAVIPGRWIREDRGIILAKSIANSARMEGLFESSLTASWTPGTASPITMFVATDVQKGQRLIFSPVAGEGFTEWFPNSTIESQRDVKIGEAAAASARFPWVTPTARLQVSDTIFRLIGDGGYFENSGAETVLDIVQFIESHAERKRSDRELGNTRDDPDWTGCQLVISRTFSAEAAWDGCDIHVFLAYFPVTSRTTGTVGLIYEKEANPTQSFLFDPLRLMLNVREGRGDLALDRAKERFCGFTCTQIFTPDSGIFGQGLPLDVIDLPLGWYLPASAASLISESVPSARCARFDDEAYRKSYRERIAKLRHLFKEVEADQEEDAVQKAYDGLQGNACTAETMAYLFNPHLKKDVAYGIEGYGNN